MKRTIVITGYNGMLGQTAVRFFSSQGYPVVKFTERFENDNPWPFIDKLNLYPDSVVLNAIGKIKQKTTDASELLAVNTLLPLVLSESLHPGITLIHPGTDCVFDGISGAPYRTDCAANARDAYGWSKRLGEKALQSRDNTIIFRVSIIGTDTSVHPKGLLGWFLSNSAGAELKGFSNHLWNGITALEWCRQVEKILQIKNWTNEKCHLFQLGTKESLTKYQMLFLFQKMFNTNFIIESVTTDPGIDRRLMPDIICPPLEKQIAEMIHFSTLVG